MASMNGIQHLVEAALYVDDLDRAETFYRDVLGWKSSAKSQGGTFSFGQAKACS